MLGEGGGGGGVRGKVEERSIIIINLSLFCSFVSDLFFDDDVQR